MLSQPLLFKPGYVQADPLRDQLIDAYRLDENKALDILLEAIKLTPEALHRIHQTAYELVVELRDTRSRQGGLDAFLSTYDLSTTEGIVLMCIAEAMLRIPDNKTIDNLIRDKLTSANWNEQLGKSESLFVNIATWSLMLTGKIIEENEKQNKKLKVAIKRVAKRASEPVIRKAVAQAMKILGQQFVMGQSISEALKNAKADEKRGYCHSFDMLGEAARTDEDAQRYYDAYQDAIKTIGAKARKFNPATSPGISIKLSALYPRYEFAQQDKAIPLLTTRLLALAQLAKQYNIDLTVDAEEADRLGISLDIIKPVFLHPDLADWEGFGLAVQAYQKRAFYLIDWLQQLSKTAGKRIAIRLVKGAYWDSEIKLSQELGLPDYPVFTRKVNTDVSYIACAQKLLCAPENFYPKFATHNPHTLTAILEMATVANEFEFQCLHGMGQSLYDPILKRNKNKIHCRIYAPVGSHKDLLPYLVRRLLENGANTSFVNRIMDKDLSIEDIIADPIQRVTKTLDKKHSKIPLPIDIYGKGRKNSLGIDLTDCHACEALASAMEQASQQDWSSISGTGKKAKNLQPIFDPANQQLVGNIENATQETLAVALQKAQAAVCKWDALGANPRADILDNIAIQLEQQRANFMYLAVREAGKTIPDALAEVREAIDFCRYYAQQARKQLAKATIFKGPTGESNQLEYHGRGIFACISPWNFPLAIFTGQVVAALVTGNCVLAKPAEQTPLIAAAAVKLFHQAGIPEDVLQIVPGDGETIGAALVQDERISGVMFTGSTEVAKAIQRGLANRDGAIVPLIAETGGQNAMLVDSSALPEQVVDDVILSAFGSAGQRCSALRVLFLQEDVADNIITMLKGAMAKLNVGDPGLLEIDVGPVIDAAAKTNLEQHVEKMRSQAKLIYQVPLSANNNGHFIAPTAFEIKSIQQLKREVFGPILHVVRFKLKDLSQILEDINNTGYGLTLGIHSRIQDRIQYIHQRLKVGNTYVNRNMTGAVVGVQPFGGEGLSGTGPKAGGPNYLHRLCVERTLTVNTTATGGNASLLTLTE